VKLEGRNRREGLRGGGGWKGGDLGFWEGEGEKGKAGRGGGLTAVKGESDSGLGIVLFIIFLKPVRFGPVQSI
jgi:hypothetical protein